MCSIRGCDHDVNIKSMGNIRSISIMNVLSLLKKGAQPTSCSFFDNFAGNIYYRNLFSSSVHVLKTNFNNEYLLELLNIYMFETIQQFPPRDSKTNLTLLPTATD